MRNSVSELVRNAEMSISTLPLVFDMTVWRVCQEPSLIWICTKPKSSVLFFTKSWSNFRMTLEHSPGV